MCKENEIVIEQQNDDGSTEQVGCLDKAQLISLYALPDEDSSPILLSDNNIYILEGDTLPILIKREQVKGDIDVNIGSIINDYIEIYDDKEHESPSELTCFYEQNNEAFLFFHAKKCRKISFSIEFVSQEGCSKIFNLNILIFPMIGDRKVYDCNIRQYQYGGLPGSAQWIGKIINGIDVTTAEDFSKPNLMRIQWEKGHRYGKLFIQITENYIYPIKIEMSSCPLCSDWNIINAVIDAKLFVRYQKDCQESANKQLDVAGFKSIATSWYGADGLNKNVIPMYVGEDIKNGTIILKAGPQKENFYEGIKYIKDSLILHRKPVVVGVDYGLAPRKGSDGNYINADMTTDHYIVIVGMGSDENGNFFHFYDNAAHLNRGQQQEFGTSNFNKLYCFCQSGYSLKSRVEDSKNTFILGTPWKYYIVSHIRKTATKNK